MVLNIAIQQNNTVKYPSKGSKQISLYDIAKDSTSAKYRISNTGSTELGRNTSYGESKYDYGLNPSLSLNEGEDLEELIIRNREENKRKEQYKFVSITVIVLAIVTIMIFLLKLMKKESNN